MDLDERLVRAKVVGSGGELFLVGREADEGGVGAGGGASGRTSSVASRGCAVSPSLARARRFSLACARCAAFSLATSFPPNHPTPALSISLPLANDSASVISLTPPSLTTHSPTSNENPPPL